MRFIEERDMVLAKDGTVTHARFQKIFDFVFVAMQSAIYAVEVHLPAGDEQVALLTSIAWRTVRARRLTEQRLSINICECGLRAAASGRMRCWSFLYLVVSAGLGLDTP